MESFTNYPDTELEVAHSNGFEIVMTPRLDAEVSCVYFGWSPPQDVFFNPMKFPPVPAKVRRQEKGVGGVGWWVGRRKTCVCFACVFPLLIDTLLPLSPPQLQQQTNQDKKDIAAAFISNCGARSLRLQALESLQANGVTVHSHGRCANNIADTKKDDLLPTIKFSLAFENSVEVDYVTEKYLQALNFGAVPVVIGAPNIQVGCFVLNHSLK